MRHDGEKTEDKFQILVPNSRESSHPKRGDVMLSLDDELAYVEVKFCGSRTVNQVRPIKFITCAIWAPQQDCWYVLAPDQQVLFAARKNRGHHTEIPFECMNFSLSSLTPEFYTKTSSGDLEAAIHSAIRRGREAKQLKELMDALFKEITELKKRYVEAVGSVE